ncbi:hypothetical protein [Kibdelosporangium phytohabitans]|uniref:Uncharacterized protein n=1 Tax=Kibdelosporangium phytohabitans TaxID=860235 RepID=A0A0N9I3D0_9PSEU|nr:hypothetical protein [Kibdelosporangium phytohabitans]ALG08768.1 hypothetical protein AOZ06_19255 [Kibdelosporangium phytohabitans]MBE1470108.1 hypothetical protein [Kibdelosporangium phytohabitans]
MTVVLSAREHWCRPGEKILFLWSSKLDKPRFEVEGLEPNGDPKRNVLSKALGAVGRGAATVALGAVDAVMAATDDNYGDEGDNPSGPEFLNMLITGPGPDCMSVRAVQPWRRRQLPGWEDIHGTWVLTAQRLAWLVDSAVVRRLAEQEEKGKPGLTGNLVRAVAGIAVDAARSFADDHPAGKPVLFPEVEAGVEIPREALRSVDILFGLVGRLGEHEPCYLQVVLADGSGMRLCVGHGPRTAEMARTWISGS